MPIETRVIDDDEEWKRILSALGDVDGEISIGIQQTEGAKVSPEDQEAFDRWQGKKEKSKSRAKKRGPKKARVKKPKGAKGAPQSTGQPREGSPKNKKKKVLFVTVFDKAVWNEFGEGVPERSFLRSTFEERSPAWEEWGRKQLGEVVDGKRDIAQALARIGAEAQGDVMMKIEEGPFVPNSETTIRRKKSSRPLIDTGQLRQSIRYLVDLVRGKSGGS